MTEANINLKKPKFFTTPIADSGTKNDIPATGGDDAVSQQLGFGSKFSTPRGSGGKSVGRADMNGLFNGVSSLNYYFQYMGRNPWVSGQSYPKGAKAWYNDAEYVSNKDDNTDTPGATGVTTWIKLNDLSGTSGGGTTVDCAWSGYSSQIQGLLSNAATISTVNNNVNTISGHVSTLTSDVSTLKTTISSMNNTITSMQSSIASIDTKVSGSAGGEVLYNPDLYNYAIVSASKSNDGYPLVGYNTDTYTFPITGDFYSKGFRIISFDISDAKLIQTVSYADGLTTPIEGYLKVSYKVSGTVCDTELVSYGYTAALSKSTSGGNMLFGRTRYNLPSGLIKPNSDTSITARLFSYNQGSSKYTSTVSICIAALK